MKWFRHDSNANNDAKLTRVRIKYGLEGYGLYWYVLELIANKIDSEHLTFELEHDCEIIAFNTGINYQRVQEMMAFMVDLGLFESSDGIIFCLKMAKRLDDTVSRNPEIKKLRDKLKKHHEKLSQKQGNPEGIPEVSEDIPDRVDQIRLEEREKGEEPLPLDFKNVPKEIKDPFKEFVVYLQTRKQFDQQNLDSMLKRFLMMEKNGMNIQMAVTDSKSHNWLKIYEKPEYIKSVNRPEVKIPKPYKQMSKAARQAILDENERRLLFMKDQTSNHAP